ncbi:MAG: hypothetical protein JSS49_17020 [Planctomycetes bacterium]|nr:hypothetical protein [Planctomycetota bacterium]
MNYTAESAAANGTNSVLRPGWSRWKYCVRLVLARHLASIRLHHSHLDLSVGRTIRIKRRTRWSAILIPLGNAWLRLQGTLSTALPLPEWLLWETAVGRALGRTVGIEGDQRGIQVADHPGICLAVLLQSNIDLPMKLAAIQAAATALRRLHQACIDGCGLINWPLSHGDATSRNVIIDPATGTATWIDFDMRHLPTLATTTRRADDLRALLWSSLADLAESAFADGIAAGFDGYADAAIESEVRDLTLATVCPTTFELAQAPFSANAFVVLQALLRARSPDPFGRHAGDIDHGG